jgi:hypothetical protein
MMARDEASAVCRLFVAAAGTEGVCVVVEEVEEGGRLDETGFITLLCASWRQGRGLRSQKHEHVEDVVGVVPVVWLWRTA